MNTKQFNKYLEMVRQNKIEGLTAIYKHYYKEITITIFIKLKGVRLIEELATRVISNIYLFAKSTNYIKNPKSWIYEIVSKTIDEIKKPESYEVMSQFYGRLEKRLGNLSKTEREALVMCYAFEYKFGEISKKMNIPIMDLINLVFDMEIDLGNMYIKI